jgi:hypothetical protein
MDIPTEIQFGNRKLDIPSDITSEENARLSVVLSFASMGCLVGVAQEEVDSWLTDMGVSRLFSDYLNKNQDK